jgi:putative hydrolase of HD superfamily
MGAAEKTALEEEAMTKFACDMPSPKIRELWEEYEHSATREAVFVRDMNLVDMCLQALKYEREKRYDESPDNKSFTHFRRLDEFFATAAPRIRTETGKSLFEEIYGMYRRIAEAG